MRKDTAEPMAAGPGRDLPAGPARAALGADAVALATRWIAEAAAEPMDPAARRLAGILKDPGGLHFTVGFVDEVMRPEGLAAAAGNLHRIAPLVPAFLPWPLKAAVRLGGAIAPAAPYPVVPIARRVLRRMVDHLIVDARPKRLGRAIARLRSSGHRLNINLLGEAVLGEAEAARRLAGVQELIRRPDVDYVSIKVSSVVSHLSLWAFDQVVAEVVRRLTPLYAAAASHHTFVNLDMEEYHDLDLTIAVFTRILDDPALRKVEAGIVLQAYLPDSLGALDRLTSWAQDRVARGGTPIKVRVVKGANLAMEKVDAALHGWPQAPYATKAETDANYLRLLDAAFRPERVAAVRIGVAGHNLFHISYAWLLAGERGVRAGIEFEMLLGMAQGQVAAVSRTVGPVLLYVPVVRPAHFDVAISYLVRRLEENASSDNFLSAAFELHSNTALFERERDRFRTALERMSDPTLPAHALRTQDRTRDRDHTQDHTGDAVQTPLRSRPGATAGAAAPAGPAAFSNTRDTDPALPANRAWAAQITARIPGSTAGNQTLAAARVTDAAALDAILARVRRAGEEWGATPARDRAVLLRRAARSLESRRAVLIEVAASETGKVLAEADVEVSEAVDFADYYADRAQSLEAIPGAEFVPSQVSVVAPPWNFPISIPAGGVLAALAAGSGVVFKPAPQARRCAAVIAEALWDAGVPRELLTLADVDEGTLGRHLIAHPGVDRVVLTGSFDTARLFRSWRPDLPLLAETSGKNSMIIMPSADLDLAVADLVKSAFGHAGQKCSAASLAILVGPVRTSARFRRQLVDSVRSLRVGPPEDPDSEVGPVIEVPHGKLEWALTSLGEGERWLVEPHRLDRVVPGDDRYWSPGVRTGVRPGSRFHREEFFGPVLGIMSAGSLEEAIRLQNAVEYGLTAGLHTQDPHDLAVWLERVQAGNLYVNRGITGAIVRRQPFGGWKHSAVGAGAKAGGPNYLMGLGAWRPAAREGRAAGEAGSATPGPRIRRLIEAAGPVLTEPQRAWLTRAARSDEAAWRGEFGRTTDVSGLTIERNLFRYRPLPVQVRAAGDTPTHLWLRVVLAGLWAGSALTVSVPEVPEAVRAVLHECGVDVQEQTEQEWLDTLAHAPARPPRIRLVGAPDALGRLHGALARAVGGDPALAVYDNETTGAGRVELLPFLHEQAIAITAHRFGDLDTWSQNVI